MSAYDQCHNHGETVVFHEADERCPYCAMWDDLAGLIFTVHAEGQPMPDFKSDEGLVLARRLWGKE